ncbi:phosphatidylglycerophosphatase B [Citrobacter sp. R56]|uniref:phosphatidylglycerophosphatase B n=1 Tax=Citrobacter sp. R56 TaxID=1573676 RepID=UPI00193B1209|nr:phosphatidylglycerophosphatase B [Citrobacter sp. R56]QRG81007.1 phosphatidylglycerophosphatase B [Citrobacter sp. R56]
MLSIAKRTAVGAALLLAMPVAVWISGWTWQPGHNVWWLKALYWVTETVTQPWGIITHVILCVWFLWCLRFRLNAAIMLFAILAAAIMLGQGIKSWVKEHVQEPRPFVIWLEKTHHIPVDEFYTLKRKERGNLVKEQLSGQHDIPSFLRKHWQKETGFAFPSGHTMFAASWALLAVGLLWPRRRTLTIALLLVWATGVMGSRMVLGMHWPRDLVVATVISWLLVTLATWLAQRLCGPLTPPVEEVREIAEREQED